MKYCVIFKDILLDTRFCVMPKRPKFYKYLISDVETAIQKFEFGVDGWRHNGAGLVPDKVNRVYLRYDLACNAAVSDISIEFPVVFDREKILSIIDKELYIDALLIDDPLNIQLVHVKTTYN